MNASNHERAESYAHKVESKAAKTASLNEAVAGYLSLRRAFNGRSGGDGEFAADDVAQWGAKCIVEARRLYPNAGIRSTLRHDYPSGGITHASGPGWEVNENRNREVQLFVC